MLHEEMMVRFQPEWSLGKSPRQSTEKAEAEQAPDPGRLKMAAAVVGNTLAGGVFRGFLLLLPTLIERLLAIT
jgi:hypothetical protein